MRLLFFSAVAAACIAAVPAHAQVRPLGFGVKVGSVPQAGFDIHLNPRIGVRLFGSIDDDGDGIATLSLPYRLPSAGRATVFLAPSITFIDYEDLAFIGGMIGAEYDLASRISLFGEFALDIGLDEPYQDFTTGLNTGIGAFYRF